MSKFTIELISQTVKYTAISLTAIIISDVITTAVSKKLK